jgi:hypothetical protein
MAEGSGEVGCEPWVAIGDDPLWGSEPWNEMFQILVCYTWSIDRFAAWYEFSCFGAPLVYNCEYGIVSIRSGKVCYQIHGYVLEGSFRRVCVKTL